MQLANAYLNQWLCSMLSNVPLLNLHPYYWLANSHTNVRLYSVLPQLVVGQRANQCWNQRVDQCWDQQHWPTLCEYTEPTAMVENSRPTH